MMLEGCRSPMPNTYVDTEYATRELVKRSTASCKSEGSGLRDWLGRRGGMRRRRRRRRKRKEEEEKEEKEGEKRMAYESEMRFR